MKNNQANRIFVVGNEKGGAGKTTCSMHLITGLLYNGHTVASIDTDSRQGSLTNYLKKRNDYNLKNPGNTVSTPQHFHLTESQEQVVGAKEEDEKLGLNK